MGGDSWRQGHGPGPVLAATTNSDAAGTSEERLQEIFRSLDRNDDGRLDGAELDAALQAVGLPAGKLYLRDLFSQYDRNADGEVTFDEFRRYVETKEAAVARAFERMDADGSGQLDSEEVQRAVTALGIAVTSGEVEKMIQLLDRDGDGRVDYQEFRRFVLLLPGAHVSRAKILAAWLDSADWIESMEYRLGHIPASQPLERLLAGGVAGAVSRTVVAPMERVRTIMMADPSARQLVPVVRSMWADGGVRGLFRGNVATLMKVFPCSAIQFAVYDAAKELMLAASADKTAELSSLQNFSAGLAAGATACTATYPLEALRTQIQVAKGSGTGYLTLLRGALAERGPRGLFQGYSAGLAKDSMSNALGFATYEVFLSTYRRWTGEPAGTSTRGALGGAAAFVTMTGIMPLENVMRRLQVQGRPGFPRQYSGALDCISQMLRKEGLASFWRGSVSSWAKVVPSIAATRVLYEALCQWGGVGGVRRYRLPSEQGGG